MNRSGTDDNQIDKKFHFVATNPVTGKTYTDNDGLILLAKDRAVPAALRTYRAECVRLEAAPEQIEGVDRLIERVDRFQAGNPDLLKVADLTPEELSAHADQAAPPAETATEPGVDQPTDADGEPGPEAAGA